MRILEKLAKFLPVAVLLLILVGALVKSHEAGLSVPDWPTTYGENMFLYHPSKWVGGILYEHGHRLLASGVGLLTLILCGLSLVYEKRSWLKYTTCFALFLVILQGVLGGLTVLMKLPLIVSAAHGILAQTFLILTAFIAYAYSDEFKNTKSKAYVGPLFKITFVLLIAAYLQLFFGATMRHAEAGLAVPDFPTVGGEIIPSFSSHMLEQINQQRHTLYLGSVGMLEVVLHLLHRVYAFVLFALIIFTVRSFANSNPSLRKNAVWILIMALSEICLGIFTVLAVRPPFLASAHVLLGAVLLVSIASLLFRTYHLGAKCDS